MKKIGFVFSLLMLVNSLLFGLEYSTEFQSQANSTEHRTETLPEAVSYISPEDGFIDIPITGYLNWNSSSEAEGYRVYLSDDFQFTGVNPIQQSDTSYVYYDLNFETTYYWKVIPYNAIGETIDDIAIWSFTTTYDQTIPMPITLDFESNLPEEITDTNMSITTEHGNISNVLSKNIYSTSTNAYVQFQKMNNISQFSIIKFDYRFVNYSSPYLGITLVENHDYLEVKASLDNGNSFFTIDQINSFNHVESNEFVTYSVYINQLEQQSVIFKFEINDDTVNDYYVDIDNIFFGEEELELLPPTNLQALVQNGSINLDWSAPEQSEQGSFFIGYNVYRDGDLIMSGLFDTIYSDTNLTSGETYSYYVTALYEEGESESSNVVETEAVILILAGEGTELNPYLISDLEDLYCLSITPDYWSVGLYFEQTADIDAGDTENWNEGAGFSPIGLNDDYFFNGNYNGQSHIISNLHINRPTAIYQGLFGFVSSANLSQLGIVDAVIIGDESVGSLVGLSYSSAINNSYATGEISGSLYAGGLVGYLDYSSTINNSYVNVNVSGSDYVGGLVGFAFSSTINNTYAVGAVSGTENNVGGLVGFSSNGSVNNSFWDIDTSNTETSAGGTGLITSEMQTLSTYLNADWDFLDETDNGIEDFWTFYDYNYPVLSWQDVILYPPTNLQGYVQYSSIGLEWSEPEQQSRENRALLGYNIYRNDLQINELIFVDTLFNDTALVHGQAYDYYVTAIYDEGESVASNIVEVVMYALEADFEASNTSITVGEEIYFSNLSSPANLNYYWEFGDGNTSIEENPIYNYPIPGFYSVSLTISDELGSDIETKMDYIIVEDINHTPIFDLPESFTFAEDSSLEIDFSQYIYDMDQNDELILIADNGLYINIDVVGFMVTFTAIPGWYGSEVIYFNVDDQAGSRISRLNLSKSRATASDSVEVIVTHIDAPIYIENQIEDFLRPISSDDIVISLNGRFADTDSEITHIDLTGNSNQDLVNTTLTDTLLTLSFNADMYGTSEIEITAYNNHDDQLSMNFIVEIYPIKLTNVPEFYAMLQTTKYLINYADFLYDPEQNASQLSLSISNNENITYYLNGLELLLTAPSDFLGSEILTISVNDGNGRLITSNQLEIVIIDAYEAEFMADNTAILAGETVQFTDLTYGNPNHWTWYLDNDDEPDSYLQNPTFNYNESGSYSIALVVSYIDEQDMVVAYDSLMMQNYIVAEGTAVPAGEISDEWVVTSSPYNVFGEISIEVGDTLIIEEGTVVNFMGNSEFVVEGGLVANGVTFGSAGTGSGAGGEWQGLRFNSLSGNSSLINSLIRNASVPIQIAGGSPLLSGITIEGNNNQQPAIKIVGNSQAVLENFNITGYRTGLDIIGEPPGCNIFLNHFTISQSPVSRTEDEGIAVKIQDSNVTIDDLEIENFTRGIEIKSTYDASAPVLTNIRVRHTTNTSRTEDGYAFRVEGNSSPSISNAEIDDFSKAMVFDALNSSTIPVLTNIRIRHTTNTSRDQGDTALEFIGGVSAEIDSLEIDDYTTAISFVNNDRTESITPVLTNIRVRHTTNTSRTDAVALRSVGKVDLNIVDFESENVKDGLSFYSDESSIPVLTNIRVMHTTNTSRDLGGKALEFSGDVSPQLSDVIIEDYVTGINFDNSNRNDETIPVLTNIRVRHTTNTSRTDAVALKTTGLVKLILEDFESDNVKDGISIYSSGSIVPVLTNIRVRHTTNTARELGGTGIELLGLVAAVMDSIDVEDCVTGIYLENSTRTESIIPVLTNIRVRHTTNTSRTEAIALKSVGMIDLKLTNFESENVVSGINIISSDETIPILTNIRVRHTTNTRTSGVGITLSGEANAWIRNSLIEGFITGLKVSGNNQAIVEKNSFIDNLTAMEISGEDCLTEIHNNHIENQLDDIVTCLMISDNHEIQILNNNILGFNRVVTGANSSPYFSQNIIWGQSIANDDLASGDLLDATFEYNDISMAAGFAPGLGNINEDPNFVESEDSYNLELSIYSNCIDAGNPNLPLDPDGSIADIGMNYVHHLGEYNSNNRFNTPNTFIQFDNKSEGHDEEVSSILWEFGDGHSSTDRYPVHIYENIGIYTVTLTMTTGSYTDIVSREGFVIIQQEAICAPQNPSVTMTSASINLTWEEISETICGNTIDNVTYLIYSTDDLEGVFEYRDDVVVLNWTDVNIAQQVDRQFYFILGYVGDDRASLEEFIRTHRYLKRNGEVVEPNFNTKPRMKK